MVGKHISFSLLGEFSLLSRGCPLSWLISCKESCYLEKPLKPLIEPVEILSGDLLWKKGSCILSTRIRSLGQREREDLG